MDYQKRGDVSFTAIERRPVEWVTVLMAAASYLLFSLSTICYFFTPLLASPLWVILNSVAIYMGFTVIHEASHKNIFRKASKLNDALGYLSSFLMHGSFYQFVMLHHQHHAYTNDPERDPDFHVRGRPSLKLFMKCGASLYFYLRFYWRRRLDHLNANPMGSFLPYFSLMSIYTVSFVFGHFSDVLVIWTLPVFLGTIVTVAVFDYIPHSPHTRKGKYDHARNFVGNRLVSTLTMMHAYHLIHHLSPTIPWYRYEEAYWKKRPELLQAGVHEIKVDWKTLATNAQETVNRYRDRFGY